jgi:tripartite-type tricarboxylate transporter receptor subunit TctC
MPLSFSTQIAGVCAAVAIALAAGPAHAESPAEFYKGKTLNVLVGSSSGGGYDRYSRLLARHLPNQLAGEPTMIVRNMPGAGSLKAVLYMQDAAAKDGTYMTAFNAGVLIDSIAAGDKAKAKFSEFAFVGNMTRAFRFCFTRKESGVKSWDAFVKRDKVIFGATGSRSGSYNDAAMLKNLFKPNLQIITAYPGTSEMYLGVERGEVDGGCVSWESLPSDWLTTGKVDLVVKLAKGTRPNVPASVPFIGDVEAAKDKQDVLNVLLAPALLGRPIIMAKEVPADRVAFMRKAFAATMTNKEFLADAEKQRLEIDAMNGEEAQDVVTKLYAIPSETVAAAKNALK